jgi:hypothetical protein
MTEKLKGRPPSFALIQALQQIASGNPVKSSSARAGVPDTNVWRVLKNYGGPPELGSASRARQALAHYGEATLPLPQNESAAGAGLEAEKPKRPGGGPACA